MTPAVDELTRAGITHRTVSYVHVAGAAYGPEAAAALNVDPERVFKTLVAVTGDDELLVAIAPVSGSLDLKSLARVSGAKRVSMADLAVAERTTGYVRGGISPFGQRKRLRTFLDESAFYFDEINVGGGRRGLEIVVAPEAFVSVLDAAVADLAGPANS